MFSSWVLERIAIGDTHRLRKGVTSVGRHSSSLIRILDSHYVSRHHAEIEVSDDDQTITIKDLNSVNGIFVNQTLHQSATVTLTKGDKIGIGVAVNETEEEDVLSLPMYELKYLPITRARSAAVHPNLASSIAATQPTQMNANKGIEMEEPSTSDKISKGEKPSTSRVFIKPSLPKISDDILIISDDDENDCNQISSKEHENSVKSNASGQDVKVKQEKIDDNDNVQNLKSNETSNEKLPARETSSAKDASGTKKLPSTHVPIISSLKKELIETVSTNVKNIFGNIDDDDDLKKKLREINLLVYNELTGKPLISVGNADKHWNDGECVTLSDDEVLEEDDLAVMIIPTSTSATEHTSRVETAKSPNIFDTSLNESKDDEEVEKKKPNNDDVIVKSFDTNKADEGSKNSSDNVDLNPYTTNVPDAGDEDLEELMFSQALMNDMKAEMQDDVFDDKFNDVVPQNEGLIDDPWDSPIVIKQEPDLEKSASLLSDIENSCWIISDDEDFDAELETKVNDWSNKIFSQSFSNMSMSQVYDLDTSNLMDEDEDDANEQEVNGNLNALVDENGTDYMADLYNNNESEQQGNDDDKDMESFKERLKRLNDGDDDIPVSAAKAVEYPKANDRNINQENLNENRAESAHKLKDLKVVIGAPSEEMSRLIKIHHDGVDKNQKFADQTKEKKSNSRKKSKHIREKCSSEIADENFRKEKQTTVEDTNHEAEYNLKKLGPGVQKSAKEISDALEPEKLEENKDLLMTNVEKSPNAKMQHQPIDSESPLIRIRRKSCTRINHVASLSSSEEEDGDVVEDKFLLADHPKENVTLKATARLPPTIIEAPSLPKNKGKLRGVSALKTTPKSPKNILRSKIDSIKDKMKTDRLTKDLKRKWAEKSSVGRKRDKEREIMLKECRKDKLKELAERTKSTEKEILKRKNSNAAGSEESKAKKAKVKVTDCNRGAFLANDEAHQPKPKSKGAFKIPKVVGKNVESATNTKSDVVNPTSNIMDKLTVAKEPLKRCNSLDEIKKKEPPKRTSSIDATFSQQISMPDELLLKKVGEEFKKPDNKILPAKRATTATGYLSENKGTVCKEAVAARAIRTTNKITFASMEKNLTDTQACKEKLNTISTMRSGGECCPYPSSLAKVGTVRAKKSVRFIDVPLIHYIERVCGASRKVVGKDILPQTSYKDRRQMIRRNYPIIDNTDQIISKILQWSNEWLVKRDAAADAATEVLYPIPTHFSSFEHYKSVLFPLMKLEFASLLEREFKMTLCTKKYTVKIEYVSENKDRIMLVTKFNFENRQQLENSRFDLVILESKQMKNSMFAFLTSLRKGTGSCNTMVFEVLSTNFTKQSFVGVKEFTVRPVIDNVRVEFGAFNAVYQLEATPLFQKILNPMELLQCRQGPKKKPIYRGCDQLNEKQIKVLLNTYSRIIDETQPNISLLQGPPGTGKSCVITNLALQTLYGDEVRYLDKKILICAQSNAAVDVIAGKLFDISLRMRPEKRFRLIRYGLPEKINPKVYPVSLTNLVENELLKKLKQANSNVQVENRESLRNQILQLEAQIAEMSNRNVKGTVEEDMLLENQRQLQLMRNISNQLTRPEDERTLYSWYLTNANVVCATLSSCVKLSQFVNYFDICIIDEATQSTEPWTLLPLRFGINSLVLVGDTQQLPATILSKKANELGLGKSLFTRIQNCLDNVPSATTGSSGNAAITPSHIIFGLQTQYRMHAEICRWPNQYFYRNELINGRITMEFKTPLVPFSILNLAYTQNDYCANGKITNNLEAEFVAKLLKALDGFIPNKYNSYGVITPYAHHRATLENSIRSLGLTNIMVNTIDSYQGLEKDVIVISNARTSGIGFLSNPQRLNVALTRPKKCLILCGNFKNLEVVPAWRCLLKSARERNVYYEISTNCVNDMYTNVIDKIKLKK